MIGAPFAHHVPRGIEANLKYRAKIHHHAMEDSSYADAMRDACAIDPIFYINTFGYTYDARPSRRTPFTRLPFILFPFQEEGLLSILDAIENQHDLYIAKSRDMGASWLCLLAIQWLWRFKDKLSAPSFLLGSRVENYVDNANNPKSLFWKIDYFHRFLPTWLMPEGFNLLDHRRKMHITNPENGAVIDGESTTAQFARGDRRTAIMLDEFAMVENGHSVLAATRDATRCRIFNSTPQGESNAYADLRHTSIKKLRFFWTDHPWKYPGAYCINHDGTLKIIDKEGYPEDYKPILDGTLRSIAYDIEEARCGSAREMAQEWNIDYLGSGYQFFTSSAIQEAIRKFARPPILTGDLGYDSVTGEPLTFREEQGGHINLWCLLDGDGKIGENRKFVLGVDVSAGTGSSNSTLSAYDEATHEKILEYANPYIRAEEFARQAVAVAKWLNNAMLIWESQGPGRAFGSRVIELGYSNIYFNKREDKIFKEVTQIPGWTSSKETKLSLFEEYRSVLEKGELANRSKIALEETLEYIFNPNGGVSHSRESDKADPTGAKANHGDRVIADALAYRGLTERRTLPKPEPKKTPIGSLAWRREQHKKSQLKPGRQLDSTWRF